KMQLIDQTFRNSVVDFISSIQLIDQTMKHLEITLQHLYMNNWLRHRLEDIPNYDVKFLTLYKYWLNSYGQFLCYNDERIWLYIL
ncbi:14427_t:CDS:1, partial [Racocetra persica]